MATLRSLWSWFAIILLVLFWLPLLGLIRLFDRDPAHYRTGRWFRRLGAMITRVNPAWKVEISGVRIEDPRAPYIVVSNHLSNADIPVISLLPWDMKWVAKAELFKVPALGWLMRLADDIPVDRGEKVSRAKVLVIARQMLEKRCSVMFFPEGTRSRDGRVIRFTDGAFRLAIKAQVPVLPLVVDGTQGALAKHSWKFGTAEHIRLKVLPPVPTADLKAGDTQALRERVRGQIVAQLAEWRGVSAAEVDAMAQDIENDAKTTAAAGQ